MPSGVQLAFIVTGIILLIVILVGVGAGIVLALTATLSGSQGNRAEGEGDYQADRAATIEACKAALQAITARDIRLDATTGALHAHRPATGRSGGEDLIVRINTTRSDCHRVTIESRSTVPGTSIDWRQNRRNVAQFLAALASDE